MYSVDIYVCQQNTFTYMNLWVIWSMTGWIHDEALFTLDSLLTQCALDTYQIPLRLRVTSTPKFVGKYFIYCVHFGGKKVVGVKEGWNVIRVETQLQCGLLCTKMEHFCKLGESKTLDWTHVSQNFRFSFWRRIGWGWRGGTWRCSHFTFSTGEQLGSL